ncbi:hypothetical protein DDB_G0279993 [Dictyostelium discoideum AX4]|uniref:Putative uncharacterized protein DDB_G0279993 n=1 Tax=Dictyostelium discoideum TaxID=44689 RepID=Y5921_DICDI|nr:hypothetical protein DDB_G0279993 [Dictyostelium discoideum AX4]Q54VZ6.1 RecName: Full=Putative uncharacterized protein DDB_G0279993 [Dictyostelium discoideum]EAL67468.1 hypothetical protein DDB_G0279993 [Dictyostelium discoideum AX4]|eukprot:XP_641454.1 hypothetical protein DDB_G0279993 [Dictyostelium discoideum AX4]
MKLYISPPQTLEYLKFEYRHFPFKACEYLKFQNLHQYIRWYYQLFPLMVQLVAL